MDEGRRFAGADGPPERRIGERILERAQSLAFPRYPGTPGDREAIRRVTDALEAAGLEPRVEAFSYDLTRVWWLLRVVLLAAAGGLLAATILAPDFPLLAVGSLLGALLAAVSLLAWAPWLERLYAADGSTETANVTARVGPSEPARTLVLLAHHDSKSQNLTMLQRGGLTGVALFATLAVAAGAVARATGFEPPMGWSFVQGLGVAGVVALVILSTLRSGNASPGGVDNAGSLAILLELARCLPAEVDPSTELVFLSPGAEEDHMVGAMRWLDRWSESLRGRPVLALNLDGAGAPGRLVLLERYGLGRRFSPRLSRLAREVAAEQGVRLRGVLLPPAMGIDAIPFAHRGIDCLTLSSGSLDRATLSVHSARDRADHLSAEVLEQAFRLVYGMMRRLGAEPKSG